MGGGGHTFHVHGLPLENVHTTGKLHRSPFTATAEPPTPQPVSWTLMDVLSSKWMGVTLSWDTRRTASRCHELEVAESACGFASALADVAHEPSTVDPCCVRPDRVPVGAPGPSWAFSYDWYTPRAGCCETSGNRLVTDRWPPRGGDVDDWRFGVPLSLLCCGPGRLRSPTYLRLTAPGSNTTDLGGVYVRRAMSARTDGGDGVPRLRTKDSYASRWPSMAATVSVGGLESTRKVTWESGVSALLSRTGPAGLVARLCASLPCVGYAWCGPACEDEPAECVRGRGSPNMTRAWV